MISGSTYNLTYDAENHLIGVSGATTATFVYDGDGKRIKSIESDGTTVYIGNYWETFTPTSPGSVNLAFGKPATQSSTYTNTYNPTANKAVDGNTSGNFFDSTVTSTNYEYQAWWQVDMGAVQPLTNVLLWNRTDCCSDRLSNFYVLVSDNPFVSTDLNTTLNQSGVSSYYFANTGGQNPLTIPVNRTGRYLRVQLAGTNYLSLAEVQVQGSVVSSYYYAGDQRVATVDNGNLYYLFADHLGSTSVVATSGGGYSAEVRYKAWGEDRYTSGTVPTSYRYTGQRVEAMLGLYYYGARWYDAALGRFLQADTIVPNLGDPQAWDRYAYVDNNPVVNVDPTGHWACEGANQECISARFKTTNGHSIDKRISSYYGITLNGNWSLDDRTNLLRALDRLNSVLGGINQFTSGSTYTFSFNSKYYGGFTTGGNIAFHGWEGSIPYQNYYHEIAHAIDNQSGGYFTNLLNANKTYASDGTFVMGGPASNYMRNSIGYAQDKLMDPTGPLVDAQQHPGNAPCKAGDTWCASGNSSVEEWADLVANYTSGNFDDLYGITRQNWVSEAWFNFFSPVGDRALLYP